MQLLCNLILQDDTRAFFMQIINDIDVGLRNE